MLFDLVHKGGLNLSDIAGFQVLGLELPIGGLSTLQSSLDFPLHTLPAWRMIAVAG